MHVCGWVDRSNKKILTLYLTCNGNSNKLLPQVFGNINDTSNTLAKRNEWYRNKVLELSSQMDCSNC